MEVGHLDWSLSWTSTCLEELGNTEMVSWWSVSLHDNLSGHKGLIIKVCHFIPDWMI